MAQDRAVRARGPILVFLLSMLVVSVLDIGADPFARYGPNSDLVVANLVAVGGHCIVLLVGYGLLWLVLGVAAYLIARLLGNRPPFARVVFDWWVELAVVMIASFGGFLGPLFGL